MTFIRGALVEFLPTLLVPVPNVITFQFNPESMTHTWTQPEPPENACGAPTNPLAVKGQPGESFSFTIEMNADEEIADGTASAVIAEASGVYSRLAALEMLMYPASATETGLLGTVTAAIGSALGASGASDTPRGVPVSTMPTVLFVWGAGRILPVRLTTLTVTEKLYDRFLNPTYVEAQIGLRVLTTDELKADTDSLARVARAAYSYSQGLRQALAVANVVNSTESIIGMLPL
jgi:hypothetical protein